MTQVMEGRLKPVEMEGGKALVGDVRSIRHFSKQNIFLHVTISSFFYLILNRFQLPLHRKGCEDTIEVGLRIGIICRWRTELEDETWDKMFEKTIWM